MTHERVAGLDRNGHPDALAGATVLFADDDVLRHVHQTTGEVAGVRGTKRGIGQALTGTVGVVEVLHHGQALAEGGLDRAGDVLAARVHDHALHAGQGPDLAHVTGSTGLHDHRNRVVVRVQVLHGLTHLVGGVLPQFDQAVVTVLLGQRTLLPELALDGLGFLLVLLENLGLVREDEHVGHGDGDAGTRGPVEASVLHLVQHLRDSDHRVLLHHRLDDVAEQHLAAATALTDHGAFLVREVKRQQLVEHDPAEGGLGGPCLALRPAARELLLLDLRRRTQVVDAHLDRRLQAQNTQVVGHDGLAVGRVDATGRAVVVGRCVRALAADLLRALLHGQEVQAGDHVEARYSQRFARRRGQDVVRRQHEHAGLSLRLGGQRQVDCHLVAVEVGVERLTGQRVQLDGLTFDQLRLEGLDTQAVQRRCAVEQHRVLRNRLFQHVPHLGALALHHALGGLDVLRVVVVHQALHHERLEQLERHTLRQTALVQLQLRADNNHGTARVVHALAQQVLAEAALLALEQVGQGLQWAGARAGDRTAAAAVVEQGVNGLLQHALLVVHDDLGRTQVDHALQTVVAVDHATVQVVQIRGGEAATVELDHRAQLRRDHRDRVQDHAGRVVAGALEGRDDAQALQRADLLLALALGDDAAQLLSLSLEVEVADQGLDRLGAHAAGEVVLVAVDELLVEVFVDDHLLRRELLEGGPDLV